MIIHTKYSTQTKKGGFTLIEVIAVLVLLGILAAIAVPQYVDMTVAANATALDAGVAELNVREALVWGNDLLNGVAGGTTSADTNIGEDYVLAAGGAGTGGTISFQGGTAVDLDRVAAGPISPAIWDRYVAP